MGLGDELSAVLRSAKRLGEGMGQPLTGSRSSGEIAGSSSRPDPAATVSSFKRKGTDTTEHMEHTESKRRAPGELGFTPRDRKDLGSKDLDQVLEAQGRVRMRVTRLRRAKPSPSEVEATIKWQQSMALESATKVEVDRIVNELRAAQRSAKQQAGIKVKTVFSERRTRDVIGLTEFELNLFKSGQPADWRTLRHRLRERILTAEENTRAPGPHAHLRNLQARLRADQAWKEMMQFLCRKTPGKKLELISAVVADIDGVPPAEAAERVATLVRKMKADVAAENKGAAVLLKLDAGSAHASKQATAETR